MPPAVASAARLVLVTVSSEEQGKAIAEALVSDRLAACVNIVGPMRSIYRWKEKLEDDREFLLLAKTRASLFKRLERRVRELHSYEVPEIVALRFNQASSPYLLWLFESAPGLSTRRRTRKSR